MAEKDLFITLTVVGCLIYLLSLSYSKYLESKKEYLKLISAFLAIEVFRRIMVYGKINIKVINGVSIIQLCILVMSLIIYIVCYSKNVS